MSTAETAPVLAPTIHINRRRAQGTELREAVRCGSGVNIANGAKVLDLERRSEQEWEIAWTAETFRIGKILIPIVFSNRSSQTTPAALLLAQRFGAEVTFAHVHRSTSGSGPNSVPEIPRLRSAAAGVELSAAQAKLRALSSAIQHPKSKAIVIEHEDVGSAIAGLARSNRADLIAMSTYGTAPYRKLTLGSVTEEVLLEADVPVWTSPHRQARVDGGVPRIRRIICAVDRNSRARLILRWARDFTGAIAARLTVVHAVSPCYRESDSRWSEELRRDAKAALYRRLDELQMKASVHVERGEVLPVVRSVIDNTCADLLVIGKSFDRRGCGSLVSDAYSLIRHSDCPVVSV